MKREAAGVGGSRMPLMCGARRSRLDGALPSSWRARAVARDEIEIIAERHSIETLHHDANLAPLAPRFDVGAASDFAVAQALPEALGLAVADDHPESYPQRPLVLHPVLERFIDRTPDTAAVERRRDDVEPDVPYARREKIGQ